MKCRICHESRFTPVLDLGSTPLADAFLSEEHLDHPEMYHPLVVVECDVCHLVQLTYVAPREELYSNDYPYVSSTTETGVKHYHGMARALVERFGGTLAVDIGSNVGVLLQGFRDCGLGVLGIEPVPHIAKTANLEGIETINAFFSAALAEEIFKARNLASIVTGTNVVAHIDDLQDLARGIKLLLNRNGVFSFEAPYLADLVAHCEYDTIYHEHLSYLSLWPVSQLCDLFDLELFDAEWMPIHGGSLRYFIGHRGAYKPTDRLKQMVYEEDRIDLRGFASRVAWNQFHLASMLYKLREDGARIVAISAPAKGMTLLNTCHIGRQLLDWVSEKAPLKIGKYTPGTRLPVVEDAELLRQQPEYALLLAWNFAPEIIKNVKGYEGKFITPIPVPRVVGD